MIVAHLIGGNAIKGIIDGTVIINGKELETSYQELASVCGSISLGDLDTTRSAERMQRDYIELVREHDEDLDEDFVLDNHLTAEICYSEYEIDIEKKTLKLTIGTY